MPDKRRVNPPSFKFNWGSGIELSDTEKQSIALQRAQELDYLWNFKTRNEIRKMIDPDLVDVSPEEGGKDFKTKSNGPQPEMPFGQQPFGQPNDNLFQKKPLTEQIEQGGASYLITEVNNPRKPHATSS
jgi:hypothetical protein